MTEPMSPPLTSDDAVRDLVEQLVGEAIRPQCWVLLLDAACRPLPVALPIDDLPMSADPDEAALFSGALDGIADGTGAAAVLLVLERPGPADLTPTEAAWVRNVRRALDGRRTGLHGLVLVHDGGMCLLDEHASIAGRTVARSSRAG